MKRFAQWAKDKFAEFRLLTATEFCGECGSLTARATATLPLVALPAGAIDTPLARLPAMHVFAGSKAPWYEIAGASPQFDELPPAELFTDSFR